MKYALKFVLLSEIKGVLLYTKYYPKNENIYQAALISCHGTLRNTSFENDDFILRNYFIGPFLNNSLIEHFPYAWLIVMRKISTDGKRPKTENKKVSTNFISVLQVSTRLI